MSEITPQDFLECFMTQEQLRLRRMPSWQRDFLPYIVPGKTIVVRQSALNVFGECRRRYFYEYIADSDMVSAPSASHVRMLIGSLCHAVIAMPPESTIKDGDYNGIMTVIDSLRSKQTYDMQGLTCESLARKFFDPSIFWGFSLFRIVNTARGMLFMQGFRVIKTEYQMSYDITDPSRAGRIIISGTLDALCQRGDDVIIVDFKFGGLANRLLYNASVTAASFNPLEITYSTQFGMYDYMLSRCSSEHFEKAAHYAYIVPIAIVPAQTGKNKGKWRGELIHMAPALSADKVSGYFHNNLLEVVSEISRCIRENVWPRSHPSVYGRMICPSCRWKNECLGVSEAQGEYNLDDPGYEMGE